MKNTNRRRFIKTGAGAAAGIIAVPYWLSSCKNAPSRQVTLGMIGVGNHGVSWNMKAFLEMPDVKILAVCDVDAERKEEAKRIVDEKYQNKDCAMYHDFRDVLTRNDIDAVMISTPDHWHVPISILAAQAGKDVICEKPTLTIAEGRALVNVIKKHNTVFQTSIEDRAIPVYHRMAELVRNGYIGQLQDIIIKIPDKDILKMNPASTATQPVPASFDYDMWLGPAPFAPYSPGRCHWNFRWISDYSGGMLTDWGAHYVDTAQWANNSDHSGPVSVEGKGVFLTGDIYDTANTIDLKYQYANGVSMQLLSGGNSIGFKGSEGWIQCLGWRGDLEASHPSILQTNIKSSDQHLYTAESEHRNFIDCVKSRKETFVPVEVGHRTASALHMGNIAMKLERKLEWDAQGEVFVNDDEANAMRIRASRDPWKLENLMV
ncbi:MAG: Gfo/Idh/MocA family oxidoreductase [Cyclobacteriaceae bacterium]|nr:Gfo/Idh/MocA family oxidoreductase [Cyclobacteriaceae bacterium]